MSPATERFCDFFSGLSPHSLQQMPQIYAQNIEFRDPAHHIHGLNNLTRYFEGMFANVTHCKFHIEQVIEQEGEAYVRWQMEYTHPKMNSGRAITVPGVSQIKFDDQVTYHRDYMDMGAMIYEHLPVLGSVVRALKQRLAA